MNDKEKFEELGISEKVTFRIKELNGHYQIDTKRKVAVEVTIAGTHVMVVNGLYEHLLDGTWHKR